jgi:AcrR family transcriptional regulator
MAALLAINAIIVRSSDAPIYCKRRSQERGAVDRSDSAGTGDRPGRRRRGPVPEYRLDQIASAAIALADADGLDAVTMRAVAADLGTGPASLYRYINTRDELIEAMIDQAHGEIDYRGVPSGDWSADLLALARGTRALYLRHPWLLEKVESARLTGPNTISYLEHALAALSGVDIGSSAKFEVIGVLNALVVMLARSETASASDAAATRMQSHLRRAATDGRHPHLAAAVADPSRDARNESPEARFKRIVARVLTGLVTPEK